MDRSLPLRIAYLVQDFPPEVGAGPARVVEMATRWQRAGAEVTVITGMPNRRLPDRADGEIHPDYRGKLFMEEEWRGLRVLRSWLFATPRRGFVWTVLNNATFMVTSALHALARAGRFDVLIASSPPFFVHLAGEAVRLGRRVPMVLEIRDLWPDYLVQMGVLKDPLSRRALFAVERYLLRKARHTVVVTESFRKRVIQKGVPPHRVDVVPNGVDTTQYFREEARPPLPTLERRGGEFILGYLGTFGAGQGLEAVIEAAAQLENERPEVRFVLAGDGPQKEKVLSRWRELGLRNVSIHPPIPKDQTRAFYNACDACLVPLAPIPVFQETIPSKIFEVMACERPVLASLAGEGASIVEESGAGLVSPPGDPAALACSVRRLIELGEAERRAMGCRGRTYVAKHYSREALAERYLQILRSVAHSPRRP